jgi:membrane-associated phospholipid phosphatase
MHIEIEAKQKLIIIGIGLVVVFILLNFLVFSNVLQSMDTALFYVFNVWHPWHLLQVGMILLSNYGREIVWSGLILILWLFGSKEDKKTALLLVFVFLILLIMGGLIKFLQYRPRPFETLKDVQLLVSPLTDSSFPSGHTLIVSAGAAIAWVRIKKRYAIPLIIEASLVACSRVYVGVHYPLDVFSGSILGIGVACLTIGLLDKLTPLYQIATRLFTRNNLQFSSSSPPKALHLSITQTEVPRSKMDSNKFLPSPDFLVMCTQPFFF